MADVSFIRSHTQTNGKHIGDLLWWTLADAEIARAQLEAIWSAEGLSADDLPEVPTPEKALRTAIRECQVGRHDYLLRLGKQDDGEVVYAIVLETRDRSGNVHHAQEARIRAEDRCVLFNCASGLKYAMPPVTARLDRTKPIDYAELVKS